ncbi:hypothetical protein DFH06DRAFT_1194471 [Mycena polygramma]|nr:hypothetical protein DFH06DRAFT_1194471 [Mycena polygramma]
MKRRMAMATPTMRRFVLFFRMQGMCGRGAGGVGCGDDVGGGDARGGGWGEGHGAWGQRGQHLLPSFSFFLLSFFSSLPLVSMSCVGVRSLRG